ncbi:B-box zinc finger protein 20 [Phtheirospermum japonicum]|uniref:B-box zinc finger protein 20 n=1 Tax=Phtheirospermum japonicum TaxID=374723 RepID=A0A830BWN7_9LAMI|nr:B-box zinc finger protein 20 [Phtheirospermum japonicum]
MKIQYAVCGKEAATVFCTTDEAALCHTCDNRVHNANKLANKHPRFSLLNPLFKQSPLRDICQERQVLLFCQEDRALLCRESDVPIHKANELTKKHNGFLLTGVKLLLLPHHTKPVRHPTDCNLRWESKSQWLMTLLTSKTRCRIIRSHHQTL